MQNPNAYLLFYKRRTSQPLGGKTHAKIQAARVQTEADDSPDEDEGPLIIHFDNQLPTPPSESDATQHYEKRQTPIDSSDLITEWTALPSGTSSVSTTPPPLDEFPPSFERSQFDVILMDGTEDPLDAASHRFDFPDPSSKASPTSSNEAELDSDDDDIGPIYDPLYDPLNLGIDDYDDWSRAEHEQMDDLDLPMISTIGSAELEVYGTEKDVGRDMWVRAPPPTTEPPESLELTKRSSVMADLLSTYHTLHSPET